MLRRGLVAALVFGSSLALAVPASSQDGAMRIRESALNDFAAALQPLTLSRNIKFTLWVPNPFLFGLPTPVPFDCTVTASVTGLSFDVTPAVATVRGNVSGGICGFGYQSSLFTTLTIFLGSGGRSIVIVPGPLLVTPTVTILGFSVGGAPINVGPTLTVTSIPLESAAFEVETPAGPRSLILDGRNLRLSRGDGYIEISGDADFR